MLFILLEVTRQRPRPATVHLVVATATLCALWPVPAASLANVRLRRACDRVLVPRRVDDGVVPLHPS